MKVALATLGCKVNQFETQAIETELVGRGHTLVPFARGADAYIINTCTVTSTGDKKSRQMIRRAISMSNGEAVIAVCGCYSQTSPDDVRKIGVDVLGGSADRMVFIDMVEKAYTQKKYCENIDDSMKRRKFEHMIPGGLSGRTRAMLKVEDGCTNFCTYCIIPFARGPVRSLPLNDAVEDAKFLYEKGYKELVITGIEISSYGRDLPGKPSPADLFSSICLAVPDMRVRLGSLEPRTITAEFCQKLQSCKNLCPQFHLSLQSGCDATLKRMNRKYDTERFLLSVSLLRQYFPKCAITADIITGFPGETESEFNDTLEFVEKCAFSSAHVFPYSERKGTPASSMPNSVPVSLRESRAHIASAITDKTELAYLKSCIGDTLSVLFETEENGFSVGHAPNYAVVKVRGAGLHNHICPVLITGVEDTQLIGDIVE